MNDAQLLRYSRHILLHEIGIEGQQRLIDASVLVIGAGGLGSPVLLYLASAGVGTVTVVDDDKVDATNLQRQIVHDMAHIGIAKAESAAQRMNGLNPETRVLVRVERLGGDSLDSLVQTSDVVIDCSDNFMTRHAVNRACVAHRKPLVAAAAIRFDAQMSVYDTRDPACPCYACVFPEDSTFEEVACSTMGVFAPLVGIVGSVQAAEALKLLAGVGSSLAGRLQMLDARSMEWTEIRVARRAECTVCADRAARH